MSGKVFLFCSSFVWRQSESAFFGAAASVAALFDFWRQVVEKIGIIKEIDSLGRIVIPKEIRSRLGFGKNVELIVTEDGLLIKSDEYRLVKMKEKKVNK